MDMMIIAVFVVIFFIALRSTVKHFSGKGGCCGGSSYKPRKKKLSKIVETKIFKVEEMHCDNCKNRVEETINDMEGIAGKVDLKKGILTVSYEKEVEDEVIIKKLAQKGYQASR